MLTLALAAVLTTIVSLTGLPELVPVGFVIMGLALASRREVRLDPERRRYFWRDGVWPLMATRRGSFDDIRWISVGATYTVDSENRQGTIYVYSVSIVWSPDLAVRPYDLLTNATDFTRAAEVAREISTALDIQVVEGSELRKLRPELGPTPYDSRILIPPDDRPMSMAARLRA
jgi:hypothetical protein